ncbi:MAG: ferrous iron transport protein B [Gammaproteobacteria bacterium]
MQSATTSTAPTIVLAGNPNTGKSTVFNQLTGGRARIGNYPGITVERSIGRIMLPGGRLASVQDSPGTYSLAARSSEELLALESIAGIAPLPRPDLVVVTVDASQLSRNLYLVLQIIEMRVPVIVALNMTDTLEKSGQQIDVGILEKQLGVPVVPMMARSGRGLGDLVGAITRVLDDPAIALPGWRWVPDSSALLDDLQTLETTIPESWHQNCDDRRRALALWSLLSIDAEHTLEEVPDSVSQGAASCRLAAEAAGRDLDREIIEGRYQWIDRCVSRCLHEDARHLSVTDRVDRVLLHPALGLILFLAMMTLVFQALFTGADPLIGLIESGVAWVGGTVGSALGPGLFTEFLVNGVIDGVGAFVVFLPQILMLFLFIGLMEDSGYMARVAVLMDRVMKSMGLHGRAFVPMLSGYACAVPAIMATRTMERRRDRLLTMMALPLMTCSARLPVYGLLIAAMVPPWQEAGFVQGLLMSFMYLFGTAMALIVAWVLSKTMLRGSYIPLVIEMPPYRLPHWSSVWRMVLRRVGDFMKTAGTIILIGSIVIWALLSFPRDAQIEAPFDQQKQAIEQQLSQEMSPADEAELIERLGRIEAERAGAMTRHSYAGRLGHAIEPLIEPLGFDWKIGVGIISAFAAREVFVSTMGVVFGIGEDVDEESEDLRSKIWSDKWPDGRQVFTPLVCMSLMVFFALACQCMSTLAVVKRETGGWSWPAFMFAYMTVLAWVASFLVFQTGTLLGYS